MYILIFYGSALLRIYVYIMRIVTDKIGLLERCRF